MVVHLNHVDSGSTQGKCKSASTPKSSPLTLRKIQTLHCLYLEYYPSIPCYLLNSQLTLLQSPAKQKGLRDVHSKMPQVMFSRMNPRKKEQTGWQTTKAKAAPCLHPDLSFCNPSHCIPKMAIFTT